MLPNSRIKKTRRLLGRLPRMQASNEIWCRLARTPALQIKDLRMVIGNSLVKAAES